MYIIKHQIYEAMIRGVSPDQAQLFKWRRPDGTLVNIDDVVLAVRSCIQHIGETYPAVWDALRHKDIFYSGDVRTMSTDGISIFINPSFVEQLLTELPQSEDKGLYYIEYVLIHETFHTMLDHVRQYNIERDKFPDFNRVNRAQDYEINYIIENKVRDGLTKPFKGITDEIGGCYNEEYGKRGLIWEEIYKLISPINRKPSKQSTSDDWKKGFLDGYNKALSELKKQNLVERCVLK